jgi:hypothetical protein
LRWIAGAQPRLDLLRNNCGFPMSH